MDPGDYNYPHDPTYFDAYAAACMSGDLAATAELLERGLPADIGTERCEDLMLEAVLDHGNVEMLQQLLMVPEGRGLWVPTLIILACEMSAARSTVVALLDVLLTLPAERKAYYHSQANSFFQLCCSNCSEDVLAVVRRLLGLRREEEQLFVSSRAVNGGFQTAVSHKNFKIADELLKVGPPRAVSGSFIRAALSYAATQGDAECARYILSLGARAPVIDAATLAGSMPITHLDLALSEACPPVVALACALQPLHRYFSENPDVQSPLLARAQDLCAAATDDDGTIDFGAPQLQLLRAIVASVIVLDAVPDIPAQSLAGGLQMWIIVPHNQALLRSNLHCVALFMWLVWCAACPRPLPAATRMLQQWLASLQSIGWAQLGGAAGAAAHAAGGIAAVKACTIEQPRERLQAVFAVAVRDTVWSGMRLQQQQQHPMPANYVRPGRGAMVLHRATRGEAAYTPG